MNIEPKLQAIEQEYDDVGRKLADPKIASDPKELQVLGKKRAQLEPVVLMYQEYKSAQKSIAEAKELIKSGDAELESLAREEISELEPKIESFTHDLTLLLLPKDPNDDKSVIVEIRAGTGGDEATLFAADLFRMYTRFCERQRWKIEVIDSSTNTAGIGGYKERVYG